MKTIKKRVTTHLQIVIVAVVTVVLAAILLINVFDMQKQAQEVAAGRFEQIGHILAENEEDRASIEGDLKESHLRRAEIVAFMIERHDELPEDMGRMEEIATLLDLNDIFIIDGNGRVYAGTDPASFGKTMDGDSHLEDFKPMLKDKSLQLSHRIKDESHGNQKMQYSALWSENGRFIVQVASDAESDVRVTEKFELSSILSTLRVLGDAELYAIDVDNGEIIGATLSEDVGKNMTDIGLDMDMLKTKGSSFHAKINGKNSYCVFDMVGEHLFGRVVLNKVLYEEVPVKGLWLAIILYAFAAVMIVSITRYLDRVVIHDIRGINRKLREITDGNLNERVEENSTKEFSELGDHINQMVESLSEKLENEHQYQAELSEAFKMADAASKAKSSFLFSMSHDIRTPMNAILGFSSMAEKHIDDKERVLDYLQKLNTAGDHLLRLINDVLDMARIESGKMEFKIKATSISGSVATMENIFSQEMKKKKIDFKVSCHIQDDIVFCDPLRMEQIELNIISNALKYTPEGGSVTYDVKQLDRTPDGYATYQGVIKDSGIGMSEDFRRHLFEPFEREYTSTVTGIQGTGLGLAITKRIVDQMGGTITCTSQPGAGSEFVFTIRFKVGEPDNLQAIELTEEKKTDFSQKRILLVEDNELNCEIACEILMDYGFKVETAEDGLIAVEKVSASEPGYYDIILMDIQMPNMDGYQATEIIRKLEDPVLSKIPIIACTANAFEEDRNNAYAVGMNGHLAKPIDVADMIDMLQCFL